MTRFKRFSMAISFAFLLGGMTVPGCPKEETNVDTQLQSLNTDMTATKQMLQQILSALEMQKARIAALEGHRAPASVAAAPPATAKKATTPTLIKKAKSAKKRTSSS
jgi:hypothetical protein